MGKRQTRPRRKMGYGMNMQLGTKVSKMNEKESVKPDVIVKLWNQTHGMASELSYNPKNGHFYHTGEDEIGENYFRTTPMKRTEIIEELDYGVLSMVNHTEMHQKEQEKFDSVNQFIDYWKYNYNNASDQDKSFKAYFTNVLKNEYNFEPIEISYIESQVK